MNRKFKSQASSARAASSLTGGFGVGSSFQTSSSPLSYVTELPDLSQITEANVVVAFKNLGKKDSTTKSKALEDLLEFCNRDVEQSVLQAWADIYPRTAIDNSRRVRQLAHTLQGNLTVAAGKRIAPFLSKIIGSWLAGTFDNDKSVSRSAQDALERSFNTLEKREALWALYKDTLYAYVEDAITVQTVATLSDERVTNADDAQAKYVRVVGTAMNMLAQLLRDKARNDSTAALLSEKKLWEFAYHEDSYLRRTACDLVTSVSQQHADQLDWTTISACFLSKGLHSSQSGSSRQYTAALRILTQQRPELWTTDYTAKTPVSKRLMQFLRQGSQSGPEDVWSNIAALIRLVPEEIWLSAKKRESAASLVEAIRTGVTQPAERVNAAAAWATYVQTCLWVTDRITSEQADFINDELVPIIRQYVTRKEDQQWSLSSRPVQICRGVLAGIIKQGSISVFEKTWSDLASLVIDEMRLSQPESSKDFKSSQNGVLDQARRLFSIKADFVKTQEATRVSSSLQQADDRVLEGAIQLLQTRNGKPYSAAGIIEMIVKQPNFDRSNPTVQAFLNGDVSVLFDSPSAQSVASTALLCGQTNIVDMLTAQKTPDSEKALIHVLTQIKQQDLSQQSQSRILKGDMQNASDRQIMVAILQNPSLTDLHSSICGQIQASLSAIAPSDSQDGALSLIDESLERVASVNVISAEPYRSLLLSNLLVIADTGTDLSERASVVTKKLNSNSQSGAGSASIVQQQLNGEGTPLSIFTLLDLANSIGQADGADLSILLPTNQMWVRALLQHTTSSRPYSLSITSPLQGVVYKVDPSLSLHEDSGIRDQDDFSLVFRLVLYTTKLLTPDVGPRFSTHDLESLFSSFPIALQLVNEKLTIDDGNEIWIQSTPEVLQEAADALSEGNKLIQSWLKDETFVTSWLNAAHSWQGSDSATYLKGLTWTNLATQYIDQHGPARLLQEYENDLKTIYKSDNAIRSGALLAALREYLLPAAYGKRVLNELVANATELKTGPITSLILLNILLLNSSDSLEMIPTQRMVFLLKNLVKLLEDRETIGMQPEVMKLLTSIIPQVEDIYGEHWGQILRSVSTLWSCEVDLPTMNASLRLYARLKTMMNAEDVNEDFRDAWQFAKPDLDSGLLNCLQQLGESKSDFNQPRTITAELIRRQLWDVDLKTDADMFALLSSPVEAVQTAAFEVLHRTIPQQQEKLSVEAILDKQVAHLPPNLLTLLDDDLIDSRRYMLAWNLTFDHFSNASHKLQEAYTVNIKASEHIGKLLAYVCEVLRIVSGRPVEASKFEISNFSLDQSDSAETEIQWLAVHNYYNALRCVPSLAKEWFISQKNRVKSPLEAWTQKHISPMIIAASLAIVTDWANSQTQDGDDRPLTIKPSPRGSELTAAIAVDPESPPVSLLISLPGSYPLESPTVVSRTRIGVSEKNWQSWLRTIQIIVFSTGSIIEGLIAFRKNVQGALKGQSECSICYSIIGTDMQTPNKKCGTCKNMFHGACLFRWFKSSNSSSCPLCRNNFNYA